MEGLFQLCRECITLYREEVVNKGRDYERFAKSFLRNHKHHDATDAQSKNEHDMNLGTIEDLLLGNRPIVEKYFCAGSTSNEQLALIFNELDRGENVAPTFPFVKASEPAKQVRAKDFECHLSEVLLDKIVECINVCHLFTAELTREEVCQLFECTLPSPITCTNIRLVSLFFDGLRRKSIITTSWQSVIESHKLFIKKDGETFVSAQDLSSALFQVNQKQASSLNHKLVENLEEIYKLVPWDKI